MSKSLINSHHINDYVTLKNESKASLEMSAIYKEAMADSKPNYNSPINQLQFLKLLVLLTNPKKILELGIYRGLSTLAIAEGLVNKDAKIIACDITDEYLANYRKYWKKARIDHFIDLRIDRANNLLDLLIKNDESSSFDFTYIDANKSEYLDYYEKTMELTKSGGIIVIDNILWKGEVALEDKSNIAKIMDKLNLRIQNDKRVDSVLIAIEDGVQLIRKI
jgi:predicted O-methyltransferase YrrM